MGGKFTAAHTVHVPADITKSVSRAILEATLITDRASIHDGHVESVGSEEPESRVRVCGTAHRGADSGEREVRDREEVGMGSRSGGGWDRWVKGAWVGLTSRSGENLVVLADF